MCGRLRDPRPIVVTVCMSGSPNRGRPIGDHLNGTYVPVKEPSTASKAENRSELDWHR